MTTPRRMDHPYARRPSPLRLSAGGDQALDEGEHQIELDEVMIATAPTPSRFHAFTNLARAIRTHFLYMWGLFRRVIAPARRSSLPLEPVAPTMPQDTIRGQLNKGWVPLSEHLPHDNDEVLMRDCLHCLETTITHALTTCSKSLPNCIPLLQEVETDIRTCVQLTSAQSDAAAWYTVLGMYAVLTSHINNLTSRPACRGLFPETTNTSTPHPLPPSQSPASSPPPNTSLSTTLSAPTAAPPLPSPILPPSSPAPTLPPLPLTPLPPPPPLSSIPLPPLTSPPPPPPTSQPTMTSPSHPPLHRNTQPPPNNPYPASAPHPLQPHRLPMLPSLTLTITACNTWNGKCSALYQSLTLHTPVSSRGGLPRWINSSRAPATISRMHAPSLVSSCPDLPALMCSTTFATPSRGLKSVRHWFEN